MKKYIKPAMMTLSVSANDILCSGCGSPIKDTDLGNTLLQFGFDHTGDNRIDWYDFDTTSFGTEEQCANHDLGGLEVYCKHSLNDTVFWS